ncbi:DUF4226 domain-containing protein [Mycobacterium sp.]|uniref:DUF4226 domain-containing protein n=1 Tax=Mycobacterium sp. TaxID=1785 RepID=UPI001276B1A6|nr:DUF4226 domain-containing protein [Mycobacterium sp.]KAA8966472.1 MAG: DUF4226 domain-containing protein [Mycobacterium sp.]
MTTIDDVLAAIKCVTARTGDPSAWRIGLTDDDLGAAVTLFAASPQRRDALLAAIRRYHPDVFQPAPDRPAGSAADSIRSAEVSLAHQASLTAHIDLQVIAAILNAHQRTVGGADALDQLQHDVETAIRARTDLDTPAGARDFHRYLIGKLGEIRAVVAGADLDDTSKAALMAALAALYASANEAAPVEPSPAGADRIPAVPPQTLMDPGREAESVDDPGEVADGPPAQPAPAPTSPMPVLPTLGGGGAPGSTPNWGSPGGLTFPGLPAANGMTQPPTAPDDPDLRSEHPQDQPSAAPTDDTGVDDQDPVPGSEPATGPTTFTLPNGETVTAASPELAAVIKAAVDGTPIADAFRQQGISIPAPGTAVADPIDAAQVQPADIGMFTTRHALALGNGEALVDGQIQPISVVAGPTFLGWQHPPAPAGVSAPARTGPPAPTRPAAFAVAAQ